MDIVACELLTFNLYMSLSLNSNTHYKTCRNMYQTNFLITMYSHITMQEMYVKFFNMLKNN